MTFLAKINDLGEQIEFYFTIIVWVVASFFILRTLAPILSPIVTISLVFMGTMHAVEEKRSVEALGGIALYLASWPVMWEYGPFASSIVFGLGILAWFGALGLISRSPRFTWRPIGFTAHLV